MENPTSELRAARHEAGLTIPQIAHVLGVDERTVRKLEAHPQLTPTAVRIAQVVDVAHYLVDDLEEGDRVTVTDLGRLELELARTQARLAWIEQELQALGRTVVRHDRKLVEIELVGPPS